jgi:hypothetical protein
MNFSEYLKKIKLQYDPITTKDFFLKLGGAKELGISLPYFQQIENGSRPPSQLLFSKLFKNFHQNERRDLVIAYIKSTVDDNAEIVSHLEKYLSFSQTDEPSTWDQEESLSYNDSQLELLISNSQILQTYIKVLLTEKVKASETSCSKKDIQKLVDSGLIEVNGQNINPSGTAYILPNIDNCQKVRLRRLGSEYVLKVLDIFLDRDGSKNQELRFGVQFVNKNIANQILEEIRNLRNRFFSLATTNSDPTDKVPVVFVGYAKIFDLGDLD